jgi:hypothetical protein
VSISFRSKVIQHFRFGFKFPLGPKFCGVFGISRPLSACVHQRDSQKAPPCVKPRRLSHHACLCDAPFGRYAIARRKIFKKNIKRKKSQSRYISRLSLTDQMLSDYFDLHVKPSLKIRGKGYSPLKKFFYR